MKSRFIIPLLLAALFFEDGFAMTNVIDGFRGLPWNTSTNRVFGKLLSMESNGLNPTGQPMEYTHSGGSSEIDIVTFRDPLDTGGEIELHFWRGGLYEALIHPAADLESSAQLRSRLAREYGKPTVDTNSLSESYDNSRLFSLTWEFKSSRVFCSWYETPSGIRNRTWSFSSPDILRRMEKALR